jgi:hypothetical protein
MKSFMVVRIPIQVYFGVGGQNPTPPHDLGLFLGLDPLF